MKLTEQQLAQMFQSSKNTVIESKTNDLYASVDASDKRLKDVETIADNSTLSASYQIINQLQDWSHAIGTDINLSLKPKFSSTVFNWFKPTITAAAIVSAVYFVTPNMTNELNNNFQHKPDIIMSSAGFENQGINNDIIRNVTFDDHKTEAQVDIISKTNFS